MFNRFFRENRIWSVVTLVLRLYVGYEFLEAGIEKYQAGAFDASGFLKGAVAGASGAHPSVQAWWAHFLTGFAIPNSGLFNFLVPIGEVLVGAALILGIFTTFSAVMGAVMNFAYMFSGSTSTNPQLALLELFIIVSSANAGWIGLDYFVLPYIRQFFGKSIESKEKAVAEH